tara:strand:+ start:874 stop:1191 length:318 start_codon:yes stop_codon:yes gene_type:complete
MKSKFSKNQLIKIYEVVNELNQENEKLGSHYKNEGLECFYDKNSNFMLRYCNMTFSGGGLVMNHEYKVITPEGEVKDKKDLFKTDAEAHMWTRELQSVDIKDLTI